MRASRAAVAVSAISGGVTLLSFLNQLTIAWAFGATRAFDRYLQATSVQSMTMGAIAAISAYAMVPALASEATGSEKARRLSGAFFVSVVGVATGIAFVGALATPLILAALSHGVDLGDVSESTRISRLSWFSAAASLISGFAAALLNLQKRFLLPALLTALPYACTAVAVVTFGKTYGVTALAAGLFLGTSLGAATMIFTARRFIQPRHLTTADYRPARTFALTVPMVLLSVLTFAVYPSIDAYWAPQLGPSNLSVLGYCQRLLVALGGVIAAGPAVILQPRLAIAVAERDDARFRAELARGLQLTVFVSAPAAIWISILAAPIIHIAFERGAFHRSATLTVAGVLPWMMAGMVPMLCTVVLYKALYARRDIRVAAVLGLLGAVLYFVGSRLLLSHALQGIGAAYLFTWCVVATIGVLRMHEAPALRDGAARFGYRLLLVVVPTTAIATLTRTVLLSHWESLSAVRIIAALTLSGLATFAAYLYTGVRVARIDDLALLVSSILGNERWVVKRKQTPQG